MTRYEEYINRLCRTKRYTPEQAKEFAISREVEKYYQNDSDRITSDKSTYTPTGECK